MARWRFLTTVIKSGLNVSAEQFLLETIKLDVSDKHNTRVRSKIKNPASMAKLDLLVELYDRYDFDLARDILSDLLLILRENNLADGRYAVDKALESWVAIQASKVKKEDDRIKSILDRGK